ncbi:MAG TPA: hypothetical protein VFY88_10000 [Intrasporangium sp.]|nr:hypothetical protein [Intrasporangium sp.]
MKHLKSLLVAIVACIAAVALGTTAAFAAVTVKSEPTISFSGDSATVSGGNFSGLGNIPLFGELTVTGIAEYTCFNPQGHPSPGQNPVEAQSGTSPLIELPTAKNGRATVPNITASVEAPPTPTAQEVGCGGQGSTQWTVVLDTLTATAAQFVVTQEGVTLFCWNYTLGGDPTGTPC